MLKSCNSNFKVFDLIVTYTIYMWQDVSRTSNLYPDTSGYTCSRNAALTTILSLIAWYRIHVDGDRRHKWIQISSVLCIWGSLQRPMGPPAAKRYLLYFGLKNAASAKSNFKYIFTEIHHQKTDTFIDTFIGKTPKNCFFLMPRGQAQKLRG